MTIHDSDLFRYRDRLSDEWMHFLFAMLLTLLTATVKHAKDNYKILILNAEEVSNFRIYLCKSKFNVYIYISRFQRIRSMWVHTHIRAVDEASVRRTLSGPLDFQVGDELIPYWWVEWVLVLSHSCRAEPSRAARLDSRDVWDRMDISSPVVETSVSCFPWARKRRRRSTCLCEAKQDDGVYN